MQIAIDRESYPLIKYQDGIEFIYVFEDENIEELKKLKMHCIHKDYVGCVDINLSKYDLLAIKTAKITDKDCYKLPDGKKYKYAIIVPNYNNDIGNYKGKTYLRNCIESVLNQTYTNFELIIVDDMSTDTSVQTIESYKDPRIHLIKNIRKRYNGGSRNVGIEYAKTLDVNYVCFLDSDDWWLHEDVLKHIDIKLNNHEMLILGSQMLFPKNRTMETYNKFDTYEDVFFCINKVWCTAWSRVIRIDKIVYFCEDTLMEDRVWSYKQADNIEFKNIINLNEIVYCWNRLNTTNSVSMIRDDYWNASSWCHIGHQLQFLSKMKHTEFKDKLNRRIQACMQKVNKGQYEQY